MTAKEFCHWLEGYFDLKWQEYAGKRTKVNLCGFGLDENQTHKIYDKLKEVTSPKMLVKEKSD